jgi:hypothetical protein
VETFIGTLIKSYIGTDNGTNDGTLIETFRIADFESNVETFIATYIWTNDGTLLKSYIGTDNGTLLKSDSETFIGTFCIKSDDGT